MVSNALPSVQIDNFEGPFDLLIELARTEKIDLSLVSLAQVTDAFIAHIKRERIDSSLLADFLVVASTLLLLKLNLLLPKDLGAPQEEVNTLTERLRIYQIYREQSVVFQSEWRERLLTGPRQTITPSETPFPDLALAQISQAMDEVLGKVKMPLNKQKHLRPRGKSIHECTALLKERLQLKRQIVFQEELRGECKHTTAIAFLALLELIRQQEISVSQHQRFDALQVKNL